MKTFREFVFTLLNIGPLSTLVLISTITLAVIYTHLMWWRPDLYIGGLLHLTSFLISSGLVMYHFFSAISRGPGYLPRNWMPSPEEDAKKLQYCHICNGYKAPRSHHCSKCKRCVLKMEHHCPWIANCVGHHNHSHFVYFLLFAFIGCFQACLVLSCSLYRAIYRNYYIYYNLDEPIVYLGVYGFIWVTFSLGCAVGVTLGVAFLLYYQMKVVLNNQTCIEDWIIEKAEYRRKRNTNLPPFIYPYNLGWKKNLRFVLNLNSNPIGDGINWPVLEGCDQFTLTLEQIYQKNEKRRRTREYTVVDNYSGSWFPITKGFCICIHPPLSDEKRISLTKGETIFVTRWKNYWLFGEKVPEDKGLYGIKANKGSTSNGITRIKGWFPRKCVAEIMNANLDNHNENESQEEDNEESKEGKKNSKQDKKKN